MGSPAQNTLSKMEKTVPLSAPLQRITVLDALRGFALLGVILVHMLQYFSVSPWTGEEARPLFPEMDRLVEWLREHVLSGRFINIFAFLFGLSFFIQMDRASRRGVDFRSNFIWRMVILFLIGLVGNAFFSGDIISIYALFGLIMVFFHRVKTRVLLLLAGLLLIGTPRMVQIAYGSVFPQESLNQGPGDALAPANPTSTTTVEPSFWNSVQYNYTVRLEGKLDYQFGLFGRGYLTLALFFLGLVVGRIRFFEHLEIYKRRNFRLFCAFVLGGILVNGVIGLFPSLDLGGILKKGGVGISGVELAHMALNDLKLVLFSAAMAMGFVLLYHNRNFGKYLEVLSPYGRMGLTNYEIQGVIGCLLFNSWALGPIFGNRGPTELFALGILIYAVQIVFSKIWLKHFLYGPLEWFWRTASYLRQQPFRRK